MSRHSVLFPQEGDCPNDHNNIVTDHFPNADNLNHSDLQSLAVIFNKNIETMQYLLSQRHCRLFP